MKRSDKWYVSIKGNTVGPMEFEKLRSIYKMKEINLATYVVVAGDMSWIKIGEYPDLISEFGKIDELDIRISVIRSENKPNMSGDVVSVNVSTSENTHSDIAYEWNDVVDNDDMASFVGENFSHFKNKWLKHSRRTNKRFTSYKEKCKKKGIILPIEAYDDHV